jgi:long-chain-fatty-acid--[acyl-carrier-protein] ligase
MANKVPVMLNWTVGGKHLEAVVSLSQLKAVLTSWSFLDRLDNVDLRPIQEILVVLEEMKATFSWIQMLTCPLKALLPGRILRKCLLGGAARSLQGDDEAVILFTSGTENMPKGVPLTHRNLLSNMKATLQLIDLYSTDRLLGALPPFHSFGFALTGLLPILAGIRVLYTPNPTDSGLQARMIRRWGITIVCSAPSFLLNILRQGRKDVFDHVRLVVAGAEKPTNELYELAPAAAPNSTIWIGYGITECSPVLSVNTIGDSAHGAGKAIPGVRLRVVDVDDYSRTLSAHQSGMILASGPNVFGGYLQKDVQSPFYEREDVRWYVTGDLGFLSEDGYLTITGRLKRFVKIGGEMVSLGAIEAALGSIQLFAEGEGPQFAVCSKGESEGRPRLVLFATKNLPVTQINSILRQQGFSNLIRIDHVVTVETIPLSGTGKVAYRQLESTIA